MKLSIKSGDIINCFHFSGNKILHIPSVGVPILITDLQINHLPIAIVHILIALVRKK